MELGITIPLQKFLKLKQPPYGTCPDPLVLLGRSPCQDR